jgi:1,4-alpha-glucan branching enzyme
VIAEWDENIPEAQLTRISTDYYRLVIGFPRDYYGMTDPDEKILQLAFVFRNGNGSVTGRDVGGGDIFYDLFEPGINLVLLEPDVDQRLGNYSAPYFTGADDTVKISATSVTLGTNTDSLNLYIDENLVYSTSDDTLFYEFYSSLFGSGIYSCQIIGKDISGLADTAGFQIAVDPPVVDASRPAGTVDGINYTGSTQVTLSLYAPYKQFVYVIGDFNDWRVNNDYVLKREVVDADSVHWWITLDGLTPGMEYAFQYLVDGVIRIADPYTNKVLDPWYDDEINSNTYPDLKPYPKGKTMEPVAIIETNQTPYSWQYSDDFQAPDKQELIIYEILMRDFLHAHDYATLIDTLDYLENLGINAIELMPINEFEGNNSWGYNPSFYFAPDKYYGPAETLKEFVDEAHRRGIAVIIDMVLNHSFGQSPLARLYWDKENNRPAANNPWFNQIPKHPFNVGYDMNHESEATKRFVDRVNTFWIEEYKIDGFRFDLSKGFTQVNSGNNVGLWSQYDASRIAILKRMADKIWQSDPDTYVIMEHFADNQEEIELSNYGMLLWGNMNYNYNEATMGYHESSKSDFSWGYYRTRNWSNPNLITYMESHDEERLMFKNLTYGNGSGDYQIQDLEIALNRIKMAAAFFFTYPGPKMIWQFGELGYDFSINYPSGTENDRLTPKPIRWDYFDEDLRQRLYKTFAALINIRKSEPAFHSPQSYASLSLTNPAKRIRLSHASMNVIIIGNFDVVPREISGDFHQTGTWYDFFSGEAYVVENTDDPILLAPGQFHIYTDKKLPTPEDDILNSIDTRQTVVNEFRLAQNYPNPFNPTTTIEFELAQPSQVQIRIYDILGKQVNELVNNRLAAGRYDIVWNGKNERGISVGSGVFIYEIQAQAAGQMLFRQSRKMVLIR